MLCGGALALSITAANAADLPVKAPAYVPPPVAIYNWTGFYVGVNAGYGWGEIDNVARPSPIVNVAPFTLSSSPEGFVGGIQLGYNWQTGNFVWGFETDFQGTTLDHTAARAPMTTLAGVPFPGSSSRFTAGIDWFGTVRGRLGVTFMPELLAYVTGGFAYGDVSVSSVTNLPSVPSRYTGSASSTETGWTVGGGLEYGFGNWSAKIEYLYVSLSSPSFIAPRTPVVAGANLRHSVGDFDLNVVRVGLNYRF
jgi:outer membrane immunogenic protein